MNYLNPFSEEFFLKDFFTFIGEALSYINPFNENFIFKDFFANFISWFNPTSENFFGKKLIELFSDLLKKLFVPSDERLSAIQNTVMSKFNFIDSIKIAFSSFQDIINNLGNAPVLTLDLGATKYTDKMTINVIDLNWYKPYKAYGDVVLTGLFYAFYLWRLISRLPNIIAGVGSSGSSADKIINLGGK